MFVSSHFGVVVVQLKALLLVCFSLGFELRLLLLSVIILWCLKLVKADYCVFNFYFCVSFVVFKTCKS